MRLNREIFSEITENLKRNRLRTFLTGFAVAWGVTFLVLLLGLGIGLNNGIRSAAFRNLTGVYGVQMDIWTTSLPYKGLPADRWLHLTLAQLDKLKDRVPAIKDIAPCFNYWYNITNGVNTQMGSIYNDNGHYSGYYFGAVRYLAGRAINDNDNRNCNKVIVLNSALATKLFETEQYDEVIGKTVNVNAVSYSVIGVYKGGNEYSQNYIPETTLLTIYPNSKYEINRFYAHVPSVTSQEEFTAFQQDVTRALSSILSFDPEDPDAVWGESYYLSNKQFNNVIKGLYIFLWVVGLGTLIIGIVGVSNIMLVSVRERYKEIGIRKALGAKPWDIISMILTESLLMTSVAGCIGLVFSVGVLAMIDKLMIRYNLGSFEMMGEKHQLFSQPIISPEMAFGVLFVMIVSGLVAGYSPARRATKISAIEAMRD